MNVDVTNNNYEVKFVFNALF